jgi:hypothetical protein
MIELDKKVEARRRCVVLNVQSRLDIGGKCLGGKETDANIQFSFGSSLTSREGRRIMREALAQGSLAFIGDFKSGFRKTQDDDHVLAPFDACCREDERRVYNIGRKHHGQSNI